MNVAVQSLSRLRPSILLCVEPTYILVSDLRRNYVAVLELSVPVTSYPARSSSGTSQWLQRSIGSAAPACRGRRKCAGSLPVAAGAMNLGENAEVCPTRYPLVFPTD